MKKIFNHIWKNKSNKIFRNLSALAVSEMVIRLSKFVVVAMAARQLGVFDFGKFNYLLSLAAMVAVVGDLGIGKIITRNIASDKNEATNYVGTVAIQAIALILYALIGFGLFQTTDSNNLGWPFLLLALFTAINLLGDYLWSFLRGYEEMRPEAIGKAFQAIVILIGGIAVLVYYPSILTLSAVYVLGAIATLIIAMVSVRKKLPLYSSIDIRRWFGLLKQSWPIALVAVSAFIFNQIDSVMLGALGLFDQVGLYNASYKIISVAIIPMILLNQVLYPRFSMNTIKRAFTIVRQNMLVNFGLYVLFLLGVFIAGGFMLTIIFGNDYQSAHMSLIILSASLVCSSLIFPMSNFLIARDQLMINLWLSVGAALTNILLNLILIPQYGYNGAAAATFITYALLLIGYFSTTSRIIRDQT